jgi:hypothetical protein
MLPILIQHVLTILFLTLWCLITTGIGKLCLSKASILFASTGEWLFLSAGIGMVITGYAIFLLGVTGCLNPYGIYILMTFLVLFSIGGWFQSLYIISVTPSRLSLWNLSAAIVLGALVLAGFLIILTPEIGKDALIYHLAVPKLYLHHHGFYFIPGNVFSSYPLLSEMHYTLALFFQNDILAKAMNYAVLCATLLGMGLFARFLFHEHCFPALSMLIFFSIPSVFAVSHVAYNDLFVTFFTLLALYSFFRWSEHRLTSWLILYGIFCGSAAACKYTALLLTPLGCLGILWVTSRLKMEDRHALRILTFYVVAAFIASSPFYLKNWMMTGNPFHPFLYSIFGGRGWDIDQARLYELFIQNLGMGRDLLAYLALPFNVSLRAQMDSPAFDGIMGPIFLMTFPFLLAYRRWEIPIRVILVYAVLSFLFWASSAQQIRYLIPLFPLLALVTGAILTHYRNQKLIFTLLICIVSGCLIFNSYYIVRDFLKINPLRVALGIESRNDFLSRMLPHYRMYFFVNHNLPSDARVFLIYMKNYTFLCERDCYADSMFEAHTLQKILRDESSAAGIRNRIKSMGFTHLLYDDFFLLGEPSPLSADQKRLFFEFRQMYLRVIRFEGSYQLYHLP